MWYDPIFEYDRARFSQTRPRFEEEQRNEYDRCRVEKDLRPARTYRELEIRVAKLPEAQRRNVRVAEPLIVVVNKRDVVDNNNRTSMRFEKIAPEARRVIAKQATDGEKFREERRGWEKAVPAPKPPVAVPDRPRQPVTEPREAKQPVVVPDRPKVTAPREAGPPRVTPAKEPKAALAPDAPRTRPAPSAKRETPFVAPREVRATTPERVKIPNSPTSSKVGAEKKLPSRATNEEKRKADPAPKESRKGSAVGEDSRK
jgi:hypothetical protein